MPQDFSGKNLRGRSFKNQDLTGANFSYADIRGANFTNTKLIGANFSHAKAGLQRHWAIFWVASSFLLAVLSGFISASTNGYSWWRIGKEAFKQNVLIFSLVILGLLLVFFFITIRKGLITGIGALVLTLLGTAALVTAANTLSLEYKQIFLFRWASAIASALALLLGVTGIIAGTVALAGTVAKETAYMIMPGALIGGAAGAVVRVLIRGGGSFLSSESVWNGNWAWVDLVWAWAWDWTLALIGGYIGWRVLSGDQELAFIQRFAVMFVATGGSSFRKADLTDANFTKATLKNTNFRGAILTRTRWYETQKLDLARVGDSILAKPSVRNLLVSGNGYKKSYIGENFKGANLAGVNLNEANLKEADLSEATLQDANLEGANLTKSQAIGTDFTRASLTGACLEAWNIDSHTKLEQVDCRYVYLLEYPDEKGNRERRPHDPDKVFEAGDFAKLYQKIMNTVQILLRNGINSQAFPVAFRKLMEENPEITPDSIQAIEKKGDDVLLTLKVPEGTDKGQVQRNFESAYEARLEAQKQTALLEAEIRHNHDLKDVIETLAKNPLANPIFQITNAPTAESKAMNESNDQSRNFTVGNIGGDFKPIGSALNSDNVTISGTVAEAINQLPTSPEPDQPGVKELLTELQAAIEAETNLTAEDKAEALEQVKALAEAGKNPQEGTMQKAAKTAIKILKGTVASLPVAATLYEASQKLLPAIAQLLSLV